jgi:hypothetical protein
METSWYRRDKAVWFDKTGAVIGRLQKAGDSIGQ